MWRITPGYCLNNGFKLATSEHHCMITGFGNPVFEADDDDDYDNGDDCNDDDDNHGMIMITTTVIMMMMMKSFCMT